MEVLLLERMEAADESKRMGGASVSLDDIQERAIKKARNQIFKYKKE